MTIFLIGYMASGKTTLGRALARELGFRFIDLDFYIEQRFRHRIPELFAHNGEAGFRDIEGRMLRESGEFCDTVVSCGGGTPCHGDNMDYMLSHGITIWLDAGVECICRRLATAKTRRPIVEGKSADELPDFITSHLAQRLPYYRRSKIRICSEQLESRTQIASTIANLLPHLQPYLISDK